MNQDPLHWVQKGIEIAGAGAVPMLAKYLALGDASAGVVAQLGVVVLTEVTDYMQRQQSDREHQRSAAALVRALDKIEQRLKAGDELRNDDFFRVRTAQPVSAQTVIDGVLTKARLQYEERKVLLMGNLLANVSFDDALSADDACWMLSLIDSLTYRHLLILAHFCAHPNSGWNSKNIEQIRTRSPIVAAQIEELRNIGLLGGHVTWEVQINIIATGQLLVKHAGILEELNWYGEDIQRIIASPQVGVAGL